jgi:hypothetical protein
VFVLQLVNSFGSYVKDFGTFELIFVQCKRKRSSSVFYSGCSILLASIVEEAVFFPMYVIGTFWRSTWLWIYMLLSGYSFLFLWSMCLFLWQYYAAIIAMTFKYIFNQVLWFFQHCYLCSGLLWPFVVIVFPYGI